MPEQRAHTTWISSDRAIPTRFVRPVLRFTQIEASGGIVLLVAAAVALLWANAPFGESYHRFWESPIDFNLGILDIHETLREVVNDGLMTIFFFVVGLEIKRELVRGELRDPKRAALPAFAALGGMVLPALIYLMLAAGNGATRGWGIPMATDIAFSVGVVALLGSRVPIGAKLFLLALAIVDDIGAILVIALFYTEGLHIGWLVAGLLGIALTQVARRIRVRNMGIYWIIGGFVWLAFLESGVHATLAGVALGLLTPAYALYSDEEYHRRASWILARFEMNARGTRSRERVDQDALQLAAVARESVSPLDRLESNLHPWSSFLVVPIFALANAGVRFAGVDVGSAITHPVALGVTFGLLVGKPLGCTLFAYLAVRLGIGSLSKETTWAHIFGVAIIAGIGFTVSLFITELAFADPHLIDRAKIGIFIGSIAAGLLGYLFLRASPAPPGKEPDTAVAPIAVPGR